MTSSLESPVPSPMEEEIRLAGVVAAELRNDLDVAATLVSWRADEMQMRASPEDTAKVRARAERLRALAEPVAWLLAERARLSELLDGAQAQGTIVEQELTWEKERHQRTLTALRSSEEERARLEAEMGSVRARGGK